MSSTLGFYFGFFFLSGSSKVSVIVGYMKWAFVSLTSAGSDSQRGMKDHTWDFGIAGRSCNHRVTLPWTLLSAEAGLGYENTSPAN